MSGTRDNPGVIAPPPAIFGGFLLLGYLVNRVLPFGLIHGTTWIGIGLVVSAGVILLICLIQFRRARTAVEPWRPTTAIVDRGFYGVSRNPIYLAFALCHVGAGLVFANAWMVATLIPAIIVVHYGVVLREEKYLAAKFGDSYRDYQSRVSRWL